jgi:hypothetical protein
MCVYSWDHYCSMDANTYCLPAQLPCNPVQLSHALIPPCLTTPCLTASLSNQPVPYCLPAQPPYALLPPCPTTPWIPPHHNPIPLFSDPLPSPPCPTMPCFTASLHPIPLFWDPLPSLPNHPVPYCLIASYPIVLGTLFDPCRLAYLAYTSND